MWANDTARQTMFIQILLVLVYCASGNTAVAPTTTMAMPTTRPGTTPKPKTANYKIGVGIADITGPAAEVNMMGYANPSQVTGGIHIRQFSRAFVIADINKPEDRVVFVSVDAGMQDQLVTLEVLKRLQSEHKDLYTNKNVAISGTHSHSGVAGFLEHVLFQVTSLGFVPQAFHALVDGITQSIENAHNKMVDGNIFHNEGLLEDSNINRSPSAYDNNPKEEKAKYKSNVDKLMTVLKLADKDGNDLGMINWFAVHGTSMNNTNHLISGDNKGYASQLMEGHFNMGARPGKGKFVAAFASSNLGDVSPNTKGAKCTDTGLPCDYNSSTCNGKNEKCIAFGPGADMFDSTRIIGENQYKKAMDLYNSATTLLSGPVGSVHQYVDMTKQDAIYNSTFWGKTCKAAMGFSFAAGTTDGPGAFNFKQGDTEGDLFWKFIVSKIKKPSAQLVECQKPKPILLPVGEMLEPYPWGPSIVDTQMLRIGQFAVVAVPGEFTTMSGRRTRDAAKKSLIKYGMPNETIVVLAGLTNTYSDYIATYEEYQVQRYEGASTVFGPHTLQAYINQFSRLSEYLAKGTQPKPGPTPENLLSKMISLLPPVLYDEVLPFEKFGGVVKDADKKYKKNSTVTATFRSGNPRNDLRTGDTFLSVEFKDPSTGKFVQMFSDSDWCTRFYWKRTEELLGMSQATVWWQIPMTVPIGTYRLHVYGTAKHIIEGMQSYEGMSREFTVTA